MKIHESDWRAVYRDLLADRRRELGPPPSNEELLAFSEGRLAPAERVRVQNLLACYPDLAKILAEPLPALEEAAGDLSPRELAQDWAALQARLAALPPETAATPGTAAPPGMAEAAAAPRDAYDVLPRSVQRLPGSPGRAVRAWRLAAGIAALLAAIFGGLLIDTQSRLTHQTRQLAEPRNPDRRLLLPDGQRGGAAAQPPIELPASAAPLLLQPALIHAPPFADYRLDIEDLTGPTPRMIWRRAGLHRNSDDTFDILVPRSFLPAREYRLVLYGLGSGPAQRLSAYTLHLPRR
jgi:hypothetical protein